MTNREAMEIVLEAAGERADYLAKIEPLTKDIGKADEVQSAVWQMQDYMNDLMREEPATGCDYGIGG